MGIEPGLMDDLGIPHVIVRLIRDETGEVRCARIEQCNRAYTHQAALSAGVGEGFLREAFGVAAPTALEQLAEAHRSGSRVFAQYYRSSSRWFSCYSRRVDDALLELVLVDVTAHRSDSAFVQAREQAYRSFIEHLPMIAILRIVAPEPISLFTAGSMREITGYGPEQGSTPEAWLAIVHPDDRERVAAHLERLYTESNHDSENEYRIARRDGRTRWVRSYDRHFTTDDGSMSIVQSLIVDVTDRKLQEEALQEANDRIQEQNRMLSRLARTDALTGLLNRRAMQEQLERELRLMSRGRGAFSVLLIDLDGFKGVNDRYGHRAGDRVLVHLAETLGQHLRASDLRARWGGEEFLVLFTGTPGEAAIHVADKLRAWFADHSATVDGITVPATFTGGLVDTAADDTVDTLFARADAALYQGKQTGRNRVVGFLTSGETMVRS